MPTPDPDTLRLIPLGGLGEFGLNLLAVECQGAIMVVDCGVMFPEPAQMGIERVIPDMSYLAERAGQIRGVVLTHGHEDHIGALPYLLDRSPAPVYGSRMTLGLARERLREHDGAHSAELREVAAGDEARIGPFSVEFLHVTHSIPDSLALAVRTPAGLLVHTADFKLDHTPVDGPPTDCARLARLGDEGVLVLLSDSTNADRRGHTPSERRVRDGLEPLVAAAAGRVLVATFASNVHRIQQLVDLAVRHRRFVCFAGRSVAQACNVAEEIGRLRIPPGTVVEPREVASLPPHRVLVIAGGSQGEPRSALARIALNDHREITLEPGDLVVLSARPIPGNERAIARMVNHLTRRGARVVERGEPPCHVSGHASQDELKLIIGLTRPRFFVPVHGEFRQLAAHAALARDMGLTPERILLAEDGDVLEISAAGAVRAGRVPVGMVFLDGGAGPLDEVVLRDRRHLSADGLVLPVVVIDRATGAMESAPEMMSRGFVWGEEGASLLGEAVEMVTAAVQGASPEERGDWGALRSRIQEELRRFLRRRTGRRPMILPIVIEG